jgi:hypothetical protein
MRRRTGAVLAGLAVCALVAGCSSSSTGPNEGDDYPSRSTPDGVLAKLAMAYEARDADAYLDCLADNFIFFLNEDECIGNPGLPISWNRATEEQIHRTMFSPSADVDSVGLTLTAFGTPVEIPGPDPGDPAGWQYDQDAELVVRVGGAVPAVYTTSVGASFTFRIDEATLVATGDTLWEIRQWQDLEPFIPLSNRESISWGSLKNLFRETP